MKKILEEGFKELSIPFNEDIYQNLLTYKELVLEWNNKVNLTAIKEEKEIAIKHFLDSVTIYNKLDRRKDLIDVGTGAGFPGIVLKIIGYEGKITLLDSVNKRVKFLNTVIEALSLKDVETVHMRAEDGGRDKNYREKYYYATARAVAPLNVLCEYCLPYVTVGGQFIAMKGNKEENATSAILKTGGKIKKMDKVILPFSDYERTIITIDKISKTPAIYPRKAGTPAKRPL